MASVYGEARRDLLRAHWHMEQTFKRLVWIRDTYKDHLVIAQPVETAMDAVAALSELLLETHKTLATL